MMKKENIYMLFLVTLLYLLCGCEKDNYAEPKTWLTGRLVYQGETFYTDGYYGDGKPDEIIQFYQHGYGKYDGGWGFRVREDGTFSALLFDGEYKLAIRNTTFPFEWTGWPKTADNKLDTMLLHLKGNTVLPDIEVTPYFEIHDIEMSGGVFITATFTLREVLPEKQVKVEEVLLFIGPTQIITSSDKFLKTSQSDIDIDQPITIRVPVAGYRTKYPNNFRDHCYARIAVKTDKSDRFLWSEVQRIDDLPLSVNDLTAQYFKNYSQPYKTAPGAPPRNAYSTPADWVVTDNIRIYKYDGYELCGGLDLRGDRNCLGAISYDTNPQVAITNGKMYQTITLPAGAYLFSATPFATFNQYNSPGCGHIVVAEGNTLPDKDQLATAIGYGDTMKNTFLEFTLEKETTISCGFLFNFPNTGPLAYGFTAISLIGIEE